MTPMIAVISSSERSTRALLAALALQRAAADLGATLQAEVRTPEGVLQPLAAIDPAAAVLLVGSGDVDAARFAAQPQARATLDEVLADPAAALGRFLAATAPAAGAADASAAAAVQRIVAITSCPTGIAHTFMAAEGIQQAALALGIEARVETQGSVGARDALTAAEIDAADAVLIAADTQVDLSRFAGKRVYRSGTKAAIGDGKALLRRALAEATVHGDAPPPSPGSSGAAGAPRTARTGAYKHLMTGVSFMLPFVTAGGLLIALAFAFGGIYAFDDAHKGTLAYNLFQIGAKAGFVLVVPALAGYIAFSVADRPGIAPGMIGGMAAIRKLA